MELAKVENPKIKPDAKAKRFRPWWRKKRWWATGLFGLFCVWLLGLYTIPRFPFGPYTLYGGMTAQQRTAKIPYQTLSNEKTHPYRISGQKIDPDKLGPQIRNAIKRWPDVRDCLIRSEQDKKDPDLRLIDWDLFWTREEANVCLWRIFTSFGTDESVMRERAKMWLRFQFHKPPEEYSNGLALGWANNEVKKYGLIVPTRGLIAILGPLYIYGVGISVRWNKNKQFIGVNLNHSIL